jgi:uncharacterized protein DUF6745
VGAQTEEMGALALRRFAQWVIQARCWWLWNWDLSWISSIAFGAAQLTNEQVLRWSLPLCEAFLNGAWYLFWTERTLFWIQKPTLHFESFLGARNNRRLHNDTYAALESDAENLYYWHGVLVPAFVVTRPDWITVKHIETEENAEVRRVMIERFGQEKFLMESGAKELHRDDYGVLYRKELTNDEPIVMVKVVNSTPEPDGSLKDYFLRVPPQFTRARDAVAWTFDMEPAEYRPAQET